MTEAVRRRPYSVILFDEIEKAHSDVFNVLLQLLDDGRLTDGQGRSVDFRNTIVIMTSNLGSDLILQVDDPEKIRPQLEVLLKTTFRPEFLNRIDEVITFERLNKDHILKIVSLQLEKLEKRLAAKSLSLNITQSARELLAAAGYDPAFGARPVKRAVQSIVENPLAKRILQGLYPENSTILIDAVDGEVVIS